MQVKQVNLLINVKVMELYKIHKFTVHAFAYAHFHNLSLTVFNDSTTSPLPRYQPAPVVDTQYLHHYVYVYIISMLFSFKHMTININCFRFQPHSHC